MWEWVAAEQLASLPLPSAAANDCYCWAKATYHHMDELCKLTCSPCRDGVAPFDQPEIDRYIERLGCNWKVVRAHHLEKHYAFSDFVQALAFTNKLGALAEEVGHHPDIHLGWGKVNITVWTHKIDGLSEADFVFAAKADKLSA